MRIDATRRPAAAAARLDRRAAAARAGAPARGPARARVRVEVTFGRRGRRVLAAARARAARPVRARPARDRRRRRPTRCWCCRGSTRCTRRPAAGDATPAHARAALIAAAETEIDGLRRAARARRRRASTGQSLARGAGLMERKLISEADSRPLVVLDPRAPTVAGRARRRRARRRLAGRALRPADGLRAAAAGRPPRDDRRARPARLAAGARPARAARRPHRARRWPPRRTAAGSSSTSPPAWSTARRAGSAARPAAACRRARRAAGRRAVLEVAGCHGYVAGAHGRRRRAVAAVGGSGMSDAPPAAPLPASASARAGARPAARGPGRARRSRSSRSSPAARCTGCRCSSRPSRGRGWAVVAVALLAMFGLLLAGPARAAAPGARSPRSSRC